jgi:hypothetical protein
MLGRWSGCGSRRAEPRHWPKGGSWGHLAFARPAPLSGIYGRRRCRGRGRLREGRCRCAVKGGRKTTLYGRPIIPYMPARQAAAPSEACRHSVLLDPVARSLLIGGRQRKLGVNGSGISRRAHGKRPQYAEFRGDICAGRTKRQPCRRRDAGVLFVPTRTISRAKRR